MQPSKRTDGGAHAERHGGGDARAAARTERRGLSRIAVSLDGPDRGHARCLSRRSRVVRLDDEDHRGRHRVRSAAADQHDDEPPARSRSSKLWRDRVAGISASRCGRCSFCPHGARASLDQSSPRSSAKTRADLPLRSVADARRSASRRPRRRTFIGSSGSGSAIRRASPSPPASAPRALRRAAAA